MRGSSTANQCTSTRTGRSGSSTGKKASKSVSFVTQLPLTRCLGKPEEKSNVSDFDDEYSFKWFHRVTQEDLNKQVEEVLSKVDYGREGGQAPESGHIPVPGEDHAGKAHPSGADDDGKNKPN